MAWRPPKPLLSKLRPGRSLPISLLWAVLPVISSSAKAGLSASNGFPCARTRALAPSAMSTHVMFGIDQLTPQKAGPDGIISPASDQGLLAAVAAGPYNGGCALVHGQPSRQGAGRGWPSPSTTPGG